MHPSPLRFHPILKRAIWGGRLLGERLGKPLGQFDDYAESWEIVDHGENQSQLQQPGQLQQPDLDDSVHEPPSNEGADGSATPPTLGKLFSDQRVWLMGKAWCEEHPNATRFPLLFKFLDCNRDLSVQVHPDDTYGATMDPPDLGKTEAWVVLDRQPGSRVYAGLRSGIDRSQLTDLVRAGRTEEALHSFEAKIGDCIFIPAGTVHALGAGLLIAEIQQSSNTTFRLFDWNRVDEAGNSRQLHIEQSLEVTDYQSGPVSPVQASDDRKESSFGRVKKLVNCNKFTLRKIRDARRPETGPPQDPIRLGGDDQCHLLSVIEGEATIRFDSPDQVSARETVSLSLGETVLLPAAMGICEIQVSGETLWMTPS